MGCFGQTLEVLHSFSFSDGQRPETTLVSDGTSLYGTTRWGGTGNQGELFKLYFDGTAFSVLRDAASGDWSTPNEVALVGTNLFGTTQMGGAGTVYKINTDGMGYTLLRSFTGGDDGANPQGGLAVDGDTLYGLASQGGSNSYGTIFGLNTGGSNFLVLHTFDSVDSSNHNDDGANPLGSLVLESNTLYGVTLRAGSGNGGTVFKVNTDGSGFTVLHSFSAMSGLTNLDGANPQAGLLLNGGVLYGTTSSGGTGGLGTVFKMNTDGGGFAVLHNFVLGYAVQYGGLGPRSGLALNGRTLYGTVPNGGPGMGVLYQLNTDGSGFVVLHNFMGDVDGRLPLGGVVLNNGILYGTAASGGSGGGGIVYALQLPSPPVISSLIPTNASFVLTWSTVVGDYYQVQYTSTAGSTNWTNLGESLIATGDTLSATDQTPADAARFYRVALLMQ